MIMQQKCYVEVVLVCCVVCIVVATGVEVFGGNVLENCRELFWSAVEVEGIWVVMWEGVGGGRWGVVKADGGW